MTTTRTDETLVQAGGLLVGLVLAAGLLLGWRFGGPGGPVGADARFVAVAPGELELEPNGEFLSARALSPGGDQARGRLEVHDITSGPVDVRVRGLPSNRDLDARLWVELRAGDRVFARGPLGSLRHWSEPFRLERGRSTALEVRAWLPPSVVSGWDARNVDVTVELEARRPR